MDEEKENDSGGDGDCMVTATLGEPAYICRTRFFCSNSESFRLMERIFNSGQQRLRLITVSERKATSRLVKAGLVTAAKERFRDECCGHAQTYVKCSLTLAGRANYVAAELGLSFPQLCYLACARAATRNSVFSSASAFFAKDLHPIFRTLFPDVSPDMTRKALTQKGFLVKRARHVSAMAPRIAEAERHAALTDELYRGMKTEYKRRLSEAMQNPIIAKMVGHVPPQLPPDQSEQANRQ